jgi:nucleotide-binding universal stress UspA family protein
MFKQLLVPLDGSRPAESVLPAAAYLAPLLNASVKLVHIIEKNAPKEVHGERHLTDDGEARAYLEDVAKRAFPPEVPVERHVHTTETSNVASSIVEHVGEFASDLILMCTHGHGGLHSWIVGTIAQQVIAMGTCPVLLIQPQDDETPPICACRNILIPLDGNPDHEQVIPLAAEFASLSSAVVHLVTAVHTRGTLSGERAATSRLLPGTTSALLDLTYQHAGDRLNRSVSLLKNAGVSVTTHIERGDPAQVIARMAKDIEADMIVLGTHGKAGMEAFWEGSITPQIARQTQVPMLLVRVRTEGQDQEGT